METEQLLKLLEEEIQQLKEEGNQLCKEQFEYYGQLRGFKKTVSILMQDELDGGESRDLNAIETNTYKMPR